MSLRTGRPRNLDHHFVVDPTKFDFYTMDCYRMLADDKMAGNLAGEVPGCDAPTILARFLCGQHGRRRRGVGSRKPAAS